MWRCDIVCEELSVKVVDFDSDFSITLVEDQHSCGDLALIASIDNLSENAAWMPMDQISRQKNRSPSVNHEMPI